MELHPSAVKEETGFSAIEMLLCLIIVIMIGFVGYYIYNTQHNANATYKAASAVAEVSAPKTVHKKVAPASQKYLTIKEWGVRMPLTTQIADATYVIAASNPNSAALSTPEGCSSGSLFRFTASQTDPMSGQKYATEFPSAVTIGTYSYTDIHAQSACSNSPSVQQKSDADQQAFVTAAKLLQAE